jgi:protein involved in polysaccharide export with SLBB domain
VATPWGAGHPLMRSLEPFFPMKAALLLLVLVACAAPLPEATSDRVTISQAEPSPLPLGAGDVLQVLVYGRPEFTPQAGLRVTPAGSVVLPVAGPVHVAGLSVEKAGEAIEAALGKYLLEPHVGISVQEHGAFRVHVLGQVKRPGTFVMDRNITAIDAIAMSMGVREGAQREKVAVIRRHAEGGVEVHFFNAATPSAEALVYLEPGDVVFVSRSGSGIFNDELLPVLQGIGFTTTQIVAFAVTKNEL